MRMSNRTKKPSSAGRRWQQKRTDEPVQRIPELLCHKPIPDCHLISESRAAKGDQSVRQIPKGSPSDMFVPNHTGFWSRPAS